MKFDQSAPISKGEGAVKVISTIAQKGGVGKSTIATNLAGAAVIDGKKVAMIDFNAEQGTTTNWLEARAQNDPKEVKPIELINATPQRLKAVVAKAEADGFDFIFIDTEPRIGHQAKFVAEVSDFILIPCTPSLADVDANKVTMDLTRELGKPAVALMSLCSHVGTMSEDTASYIEGTLEFPVAPEMIIRRTAFTKSYIEGKSVIEYANQSSKATQSDAKAALEIADLYKWVDQQIELERNNEPALQAAG